MGSSHCFPCLEASFWTSESMASRIAGSGTMLDSYLEPPSFTEESRWPHQGRSRKTCPALSGKQSIPTHSYAETRETAMAPFAKSWRRGQANVRFSNRPAGSSVFRLSTSSSAMSPTGSRFSSDSAQGPSNMGFEDEVEQSFGRPRRQYDGRSKRTNDLTSSIV